jgi:hypothetical protein
LNDLHEEQPQSDGKRQETEEKLDRRGCHFRSFSTSSTANYPNNKPQNNIQIQKTLCAIISGRNPQMHQNRIIETLKKLNFFTVLFSILRVN